MTTESKKPAVSVVMSVFNGERQLDTTLQSVLEQKNCKFEFIVVNDGSSDESARILDHWASKDKRLRIIHQKNLGLTAALRKACSVAEGEFIARQDNGDISLPTRLQQQYEYLRNHHDVAMVASSTRFVGPNSERLFDVVKKGAEVEQDLAELSVQSIKGPPHHGGTMFRKEVYVKSGGYRFPFVVAQDIDLWLRLSESGRCMGLEEILYQAKFDVRGISSLRRQEQSQLCQLAIECTQHRRQTGQNDQSLLESYSPIFVKTDMQKDSGKLNKEKAASYYFIGSCLRLNRPLSAIKYYLHAIRLYLQYASQKVWHFSIGRV